MKYNLEFIKTEIIISADKYGRFASVEKLIDDVIHLQSLYKVDSVKVNNVNGKQVDVKQTQLSDIEALFEIPPDRRCPDCKSIMDDGFCLSSDKLKNFWRKNIHAQDILFENMENEASLVIKDDEKKKAFRCQDCGLTLIP